MGGIFQQMEISFQYLLNTLMYLRQRVGVVTESRVEVNHRAYAGKAPGLPTGLAVDCSLLG